MHGQPLVHLKDVVSAIRQVVDKRSELEPEETFIIAEHDVVSYKRLQDQIGILLYGREWRTFGIPKVIAKVGAWAEDKIFHQEKFVKPWMIDLADANYPVSIGSARVRLGWSPKHRLIQDLPQIITHLKKNPRQWYKINKLSLPSSFKGYQESEKIDKKEISL